MGIRRSFRDKILPWLLLLVGFAPAVFIITARIVVPIPDPSLRPSLALYASVYSLITLPLILFAGLVAPDLLCPDRRERVLSLYFVAPITRLHYVAARLGALLLLLLAMSAVPALLLFVGNVFLAADPWGFLGNHIRDVPAILAAGTILALFYGSIAIAVSAFNTRRHYAGGAFVGILLITGIVASTLASAMHFAHHELFILLDLLNLPTKVARWILHQPLAGRPDPWFHVGGWNYAGTALAVVLISLVLTGWQYLRLSE
jgi:ABC-2 type transport system permease protein